MSGFFYLWGIVRREFVLLYYPRSADEISPKPTQRGVKECIAVC